MLRRTSRGTLRPWFIAILTTMLTLTVYIYTRKLEITIQVGYCITPHTSSTNVTSGSSNTSNGTSSSSISAATSAIVYTLATNSTPPTAIRKTTIITPTIDYSNIVYNFSIDQYGAWVKNVNSSSLSFPLPQLVLPPKDILETLWAYELWNHLSELDTKYVSLCIGNSAYFHSVLNWLIAAMVITKPPLENVLVISLDNQLHSLLRKHDINSVYVKISTIVRNEVTEENYLDYFWLTRLVIFRLINYWGYTVATYDSDAIPVKNPEKLFAKFKDSDLIASQGTYPFELPTKWNSSTLCMGVAVFKASRKTEKYWNFLSTLDMNKTDDQFIINYGLDTCGIKWNSNTSSGSCTNGLNLTVSLLSKTDVCRWCARQSQLYYVWHHNSEKYQIRKMINARKARLWFLKRNYYENEQLKGLKWLKFLSTR